MKFHEALLASIILPALAGCHAVGEQVQVHRAKSDVAGALLDPDSAEFRNVAHAGYGTGRVVCGEVNGNNSFGGKSGFNQFLYVAPLMRIADSGESGAAIYRCCKALMDTGKVPGVNSTSGVAECSGVDPVMPLI